MFQYELSVCQLVQVKRQFTFENLFLIATSGNLKL